MAQVLGLEALSELTSMGPDASVVGISQMPTEMWNSLSRIHRERERERRNGVGVSGRRTCNADIGPVTLGGACRAPGHALAPVIFQSKQLLHLLPRHFNLHLSYPQAWEEERDGVWVHI